MPTKSKEVRLNFRAPRQQHKVREGSLGLIGIYKRSRPFPIPITRLQAPGSERIVLMQVVLLCLPLAFRLSLWSSCAASKPNVPTDSLLLL